MSWCEHGATRPRWANKEGKKSAAAYCCTCDAFVYWLGPVEYKIFRENYFAKKEKKKGTTTSQQRMF